ncbi:MAG: hypothetical protein E7480_00495 [Ruminococcaceae bacterium]|nr:hypothetical protein [Oscillospiraceae bacterium]
MKNHIKFLCIVIAVMLSVLALSSCNKLHFKDYQNNGNTDEYGADLTQSSVFDGMEFDTNYTDPNASSSSKPTYTPEEKEEVNGIKKFYLSVKNLGAVGDGVADDTEAFEKAVHTLKNSGGVIYVPAGVYRLTRGINIPLGVTITGDSPSLKGMWSNPSVLTSAKQEQSASTDFLKTDNFSGSWILVDHGKGDVNGTPAIRVQGNTTVSSLGFVYKEQIPVVNTVNEYPPAISFMSTREYTYARDGVVIEDIYLANPYLGIFVGTGENLKDYYVGQTTNLSLGRLRVHNITGTSLWKSIFIRGVLDTVDVSNINLGYTNFVKSYLQYRHNNCSDIEISRADGNNMANITLFGANIGISCVPGFEGSASIRGTGIKSYAGIGMQTCTGQYEINDSEFAAINYSNYRANKESIGLAVLDDECVHRPHYMFDSVTISNTATGIDSSSSALKINIGKNGHLVLSNSKIKAGNALEAAVTFDKLDLTFTTASIYNTSITGSGTKLALLEKSNITAGCLQFNECTIDDALMTNMSDAKIWYNNSLKTSGGAIS